MQPNLKADSSVVALQPEVSKLAEFARSIIISTVEQYNSAADYLKSIKGMLNQIESARTRITKPINESLREVNKQAKEASAPLESAEQQIKRAMIGYTTEQERLRREEQRKADENARKEQERLNAQAAKAAAAGKVEKAEQLQERANTVVAPVIQRETPKVSGISMREVWLFEVTDPAAVPREYLMVDEKKVGKVVGALKDQTVIAGIRVYPDKRIASGAA